MACDQTDIPSRDWSSAKGYLDFADGAAGKDQTFGNGTMFTFRTAFADNVYIDWLKSVYSDERSLIFIPWK